MKLSNKISSLTKTAIAGWGLISLLPRLVVAADSNYRLLTVPADCIAEYGDLPCWINEVFKWSQGAILLLSTVVIIAAGLIYMGSAGNTKQIELSKRLIIGALSGVAVIVLGRFFLTYVVGVAWVV